MFPSFYHQTLSLNSSSVHLVVEHPQHSNQPFSHLLTLWTTYSHCFIRTSKIPLKHIIIIIIIYNDHFYNATIIENVKLLIMLFYTKPSLKVSLTFNNYYIWKYHTFIKNFYIEPSLNVKPNVLWLLYKRIVIDRLYTWPTLNVRLRFK